ncbi:MAG TPA: pilus assembly protein PilP [Burkholderiaceae bacterium]|nr:pilus assembly protein PilP [Burkholderiaceae bacterium]
MRLLRLNGVTLVCAACFVAGCSDAPEAELQTWMAEQRSQLKPASQPVAAPKKFDPQIYAQEGKPDPFGVQKLVVGLKSDAASPVSTSSLITPELNRRKQPLEAYPLDTMSYVGSLEKGTKKSALLLVDKLIYQVEAGAYLGQNYGKIVSISESAVTLREIVQDSAGEWIERQATLHLQEKN